MPHHKNYDTQLSNQHAQFKKLPREKTNKTNSDPLNVQTVIMQNTLPPSTSV